MAFCTSRIVLRWRELVITVGLILLCVYVGSYLHLSRRGMRQAPEMGLKGFLYIPVEEMTEERAIKSHYSRVKFFALANAVDRALMGTEEPVRGVLFGVEK